MKFLNMFKLIFLALTTMSCYLKVMVNGWTISKTLQVNFSLVIVL